MRVDSNRALAEMRGLVEQMLILAGESADYHQNESVSSDIGKVLRRTAIALHSLQRRLLIVQKRYIVAVIGLTNVGKSTFLNALLGIDLAPRRNGPCTAAPIEFHYGDAFEVSAYFKEHFERPVWFCKDSSDVKDHLASLADDSGDRASREIEKVVVKAPIPLLSSGLVVADTPGFGAAQTASAAGSHEDALREYLARDVSQVFWVVLADQGIGKREVNFHNAFFKDICDDVVVTGCDDWDDKDKGRFRKRFQAVFQPRMPKFHFVSGLQGVAAREASDICQLEAAGIPLLESRIRELASCAGRLESIRGSLIRLTQDVSYWAIQRQGEDDMRRGSFWRPDSFARWRACYPSSQLKTILSKHLELIH